MPHFVNNQCEKISTTKGQILQKGSSVELYHIATKRNFADAGLRGLIADVIITQLDKRSTMVANTSELRLLAH